MTRTISVGPLSAQENELLELVKEAQNLAIREIKPGIQAKHVDLTCRNFLDDKGYGDLFIHGTGHGVGFFLNVHEGPQSLSKNNKVKLKSGMIISNEPGYYKEGHFGIRIENLIYINQNKFEELTLAPIEKKLIEKKLLDKNEIKWLNKYHAKVKKNLSKFMNIQEKTSLIDACSPI